ncbi:hypothetical protein BDR04DRAFT_783476 [Suillus decipiens]|nr:hypothetical protein BDR04DRAFT_783476 [Suillus decipiens]
MNHYHPLSAAVQITQPAPRGLNNVVAVLVTSVVYDLVTNLADELDYLLGSRMTLAKGLFLACRYTPFVICALHIRMALLPGVEACPWLAEINMLFLVIILLCAEYIFVLRTYALWNRDRRIRIALLVLYSAFFCGTTILVVEYGLQLKMANFTPSCYSNTPISAHFIILPYIGLLLLEIEIVGLTFYRMIRFYRATRCRLLTLMSQYSMGYILAGLLFTVVNIATICFVPGYYGPALEVSQIVAQGLLATQMQLDLWKLNRHSLEVAPISYSTEYDQTDLEFELSQRTSFIPGGTVPVIQHGFDGETISHLEHIF